MVYALSRAVTGVSGNRKIAVVCMKIKEVLTMNFWELPKEEMEQFLAESAAEEIAKTHAAGRPTRHGDYWLYPDGHRVSATGKESVNRQTE